MRLLVATHNKGKVAELSEMLTQAGIECLSLDDVGVTFDVEETGTTFLENATLKATQYATATGFLTLADDSGLEVQALDGAPGVYTARYGDSSFTQAERNQFLLDNICDVVGEARAAAFRCVMVLAAGDGSVLHVGEGRLDGAIAVEATGAGGFGYDPVFYIPELGCTTAELNSAEKHAISHRGNAVRQMIPIIEQIIKR